MPLSSVDIAVILSPSCKVISSGTVTVQSPFPSTLPVVVLPSGKVTVIVDPGSPLPDIVLSPTDGWLIVGASGAITSFSGFVVTGTVTWSCVPSGYVTVTGTFTVPGVLPSGNVLGSSTLIVGCSLSDG